MPRRMSARLPDNTAQRVKLYARRKEITINNTISTALEEWLRQNEFVYVEFRDTSKGRQAFMKHSRLPVYWVIKISRGYGMDAKSIQLYWPNRSLQWIQAALDYYTAFPDEIDEQITAYEADSLDSLQGRFPEIEVFSNTIESAPISQQAL